MDCRKPISDSTFHKTISCRYISLKSRQTSIFVDVLQTLYNNSDKRTKGAVSRRTIRRLLYNDR